MRIHTCAHTHTHSHTYTHQNINIAMRRPGIEPGPRAWKARILTIELSTLRMCMRMRMRMLTRI